MTARRFPVEAGHVLAFARALGAADPSGGLPAAGDAAPPTFASADAQFDPAYPLRRIADSEDGPVAEFAVTTVNAEGREVVSGYAHARLAG